MPCTKTMTTIWLTCTVMIICMSMMARMAITMSTPTIMRCTMQKGMGMTLSMAIAMSAITTTTVSRTIITVIITGTVGLPISMR